MCLMSYMFDIVYVLRCWCFLSCIVHAVWVSCRVSVMSFVVDVVCVKRDKLERSNRTSRLYEPICFVQDVAPTFAAKLHVPEFECVVCLSTRKHKVLFRN